MQVIERLKDLACYRKKTHVFIGNACGKCEVGGGMTISMLGLLGPSIMFNQICC